MGTLCPWILREEDTKPSPSCIYCLSITEIYFYMFHLVTEIQKCAGCKFQQMCLWIAWQLLSQTVTNVCIKSVNAWAAIFLHQDKNSMEQNCTVSELKIIFKMNLNLSLTILGCKFHWTQKLCALIFFFFYEQKKKVLRLKGEWWSG